jgi:hypothetical protein
METRKATKETKSSFERLRRGVCILAAYNSEEGQEGGSNRKNALRIMLDDNKRCFVFFKYFFSIFFISKKSKVTEKEKGGDVFLVRSGFFAHRVRKEGSKRKGVDSVLWVC